MKVNRSVIRFKTTWLTAFRGTIERGRLPSECIYHKIRRLVSWQDELWIDACITAVNLFDEMKPLDNSGNNVAPLDHRAYAYIAASEALRNGTDDVIPDRLLDRPYVLRGQRVLVHERVHGRINERRRRGRQRAQQRCLFFFCNFHYYQILFIYFFERCHGYEYMMIRKRMMGDVM